MVKQVNTLDLKSSGSDALPVRFRPVAPHQLYGDIMRIKPRNWVARQCRDLNGPFRPTVERDHSKYTRKQKHKERYG